MQELISLLLIAAFLAWEADRAEPKPISIGNGDTLMVRIMGYGFCPKHCDVDHHHIGHYKNYNCKEEICYHIVTKKQ